MALLRCDREWSTDGVRPHERFAYWREAVYEVVLPLNLEQSRGDLFSGRLVSYAVDTMHIAHGVCGAHVVDRTRGNIARSRNQFVYLVCPKSGAVRVEQLGRTTLLAAGECALATSDEPFRLDFVTCADSMSVQIPFDLLTSRMPAICDATAINLARATATGGALASLVHSLPRNQLRADSPGAMALAQSLLDLIAIAARETRRGERPCPARKRVGGADVARFIDAHLSDPLLSPARAARSLAISERSVHLAMTKLGQSFMSYVRIRRLERVAGSLRTSREERQSITELALDWGFADLSTFNRAFRERFGMNPRDYARKAAMDDGRGDSR